VSLLRPVDRRTSSNRPYYVINGRLTQGFTGAHEWEPSGYLRTDLPTKRASFTRLRNSKWRLHLHGAMDYGCAIGTPVYAVHDGVIVAQGRYAYTGECYLILRIKRGLTKQLVAFYTHLQADSFRFRVGAKVKKGQIIARTGNTGWSTAPHLHWGLNVGPRWQKPTFENVYRWTKVDPHEYLRGRHLGGLV